MALLGKQIGQEQLPTGKEILVFGVGTQQLDCLVDAVCLDK
jgi:hypothetical protein